MCVRADSALAGSPARHTPQPTADYTALVLFLLRSVLLPLSAREPAQKLDGELSNTLISLFSCCAEDTSAGVSSRKPSKHFNPAVLSRSPSLRGLKPVYIV